VLNLLKLASDHNPSTSTFQIAGIIDVHHHAQTLFISLFTICLSSLVTYLFNSCPFLLRLFTFLLLISESYLHIIKNSLLSEIGFANIFSKHESSLFIAFVLFFFKAKVLKFNEGLSLFLSLYTYSCYMWGKFPGLLQIPKSEDVQVPYIKQYNICI
jgi:hypothetical protein